MDLRVYLDAAVFRDQLIGDWHSFVNWYTLLDDGVVFHARIGHQWSAAKHLQIISYFDMLSILSTLVIPNQ